MKPWIVDADLPLWQTSSGENMEKAQTKRDEVVRWVNFQIKKAYLEKLRLDEVQRFRDLKHFATNIRTSFNLQRPEWWAERFDKSCEELLKEYLDRRQQRKQERAVGAAKVIDAHLKGAVNDEEVGE